MKIKQICSNNEINDTIHLYFVSIDIKITLTCLHLQLFSFDNVVVNLIMCLVIKPLITIFIRSSSHEIKLILPSSIKNSIMSQAFYFATATIQFKLGHWSYSKDIANLNMIQVLTHTTLASSDPLIILPESLLLPVASVEITSPKNMKTNQVSKHTH